MTTDLRKLRAEVEKLSQENEQMKTELAKKESRIKELQIQLATMKMEAQLQNKPLLKCKEVMDEANKQIIYLMEQLREGPQKTMMSRGSQVARGLGRKHRASEPEDDRQNRWSESKERVKEW